MVPVIRVNFINVSQIDMVSLMFDFHNTAAKQF